MNNSTEIDELPKVHKGGWEDLVTSLYRHHINEHFHNLTPKAKLKSGVERVAQVSRGISKDQNAKMLMVKHWLEATDPKHRYGNGLIQYFDHWRKSETKQDFWYWLDGTFGEGKKISLEQFSRSQLDECVVKYLDAEQRKNFEVMIKDGLFYFKNDMKLINTRDEIPDNDDQGKFIFVVSPKKIMYCGPKIRGHFHHSSFLSGGAILGAGNLEIDNGVLISLKPHSGHYMPTAEEFKKLIDLIQSCGIDMNNVTIGEIKQPKVKKNKAPKAPKTKKFLNQLKQHLSQNAKSNVVDRLSKILNSEQDLDDLEVKEQNGHTTQQEEKVEQQELGQFTIPQEFQIMSNIPFLKRGYQESDLQYKTRIKNFLLLLNRQELVYIISKIDPSQKQMSQFNNLVQEVMSSLLQPQEQNSSFYSNGCSENQKRKLFIQ